MQLLEILLVHTLCSVYAVAREVCLGEKVNASCADGEVFFIESAVYGRIHNSRCYNSTENEPNCTNDIRSEVQIQYGLKQDIQMKLSSSFFTTKQPKCLDKQIPPSLDISYHCIKMTSNEICIQDSFNATCTTGTEINIQRALYGRMRSSRCINFDDRELNCFANVQPILGSLCNGRVDCSIKVSNDSLQKAVGSCRQDLEPYLEVIYECVQEFPCPSFSLPKDATMQRVVDGYDVLCENNKSSTHKLRCSYGKWNLDPAQLCRKGLDMLEPLIFSGAVGIFMLTAIIAVVVCLKRIQKKSNVRSRHIGIDEVQPMKSTRHGQSVPPVSPRATQRNIPTDESVCELVITPSNKTCRLPPDPHTYMELLSEDQPKV